MAQSKTALVVHHRLRLYQIEAELGTVLAQAAERDVSYANFLDDLLLLLDTSCRQGEGTVGSRAKAARMTLEGLTWIVVVNGLVQLAGFIVMIRNHREIVRMTRGVAGLVYQESEKTRARLDELFRRDLR